MSLSKFGFKCGGKRTKTGDLETKNKNAKSKNAKMNTRSIAYDRFNSPVMGRERTYVPRYLCSPVPMFPEPMSGLDIGLVGPVARGASRFENLLAPQKTYWPGGPVDLKTYWPPKKLTGPPKKLTGPYLKTKLARRKTICINLQFAHRPIIKLFRSHPRNIFQI